ncbi:MAG: cadherin-like domain-containing protein [Anaerolineae bacterium]|nr:cadherin-like domain-containing protein [Anaerolineae bacterium]
MAAQHGVITTTTATWTSCSRERLILSGNTGNAFEVDDESGQIAVNNSSALDYETMPAFYLTVTVTDVGGLNDSAAITITLNDANDAPTIAEGDSVAVTMDEDSAPTPFDLTLHASDLEGDVLSWRILTPAENGIAAAGGTGPSKLVAYTPAADYGGTDNFVVEVSDGTLTDTAVVDVTIRPVNDAPTLDDIAAQTMTEDDTLSVSVTVSDIDTDVSVLTLSASSSNTALVSPAHIHFAGSGTNRTVTITPTAGMTGTVWITLTIDDGTASTRKAFELTVHEQTEWMLYIPVTLKNNAES